MGEVERDQEGAGRYIGERTGKPVVCEPQVRQQPQPANCRRYAAVRPVRPQNRKAAYDSILRHLLASPAAVSIVSFATHRQGERTSKMCQYLCFCTSKAGKMSTRAGMRPERRLYTSAHVSIRQHTSAYVSTLQHTSAYVSIRST